MLEHRFADAALAPADEKDGEWLGEAERLAASARELLAAIHTVPVGGGMTPLAEAISIDSLDYRQFHGVLVIRPAGASAVQLISDRPLALKDPLHSMASVALSYVLIDPTDSHVIVAGVAAGSAQLAGTVGSKMDID